MVRTVVFVVLVASVAWEARVARAGCDTAAPRRVTLDAYSCMPAVATTRSIKVTLEPKPAAVPGIVVDAALVGVDAEAASVRVWIPAAEKLTCDKLVPLQPQSLAGALESVCCEDATKSEPACVAGATAALTKVTIVAPPDLKRSSRAQLEAEVVRLRAANARLDRLWLHLEHQRLTREQK